MRPALLTAAAALLLALAGCEDPSDEDLVRAKVKAALSAVDEKSTGDILADAAEDFRGPRNIDLRETRRYIAGYMLGAGWLRAFARKLDVAVTGDTAHVDLEVVLAKGKEVKSIEDVVPTNGSVLDFDLELERRGGEWKFTEGDYRQLKW